MSWEQDPITGAMRQTVRPVYQFREMTEEECREDLAAMYREMEIERQREDVLLRFGIKRPR